MNDLAHPLFSLRGLAARLALTAVALAAAAMPMAAHAQSVERFDPDEAYRDAPASGGIDGDLTAPQDSQSPLPAPGAVAEGAPVGAAAGSDIAPAPDPSAATPAPADTGSATYGQDDLIGAAEGLFGKGAEGLAKLIEDLLAKQGRPNAYIVGREAGGALIVGARYGSGTLHHKIEGARPVYWTGPSIGFDAGANAANTFVLVYNLYDSQDLFARFPAGEGQAYFIGGFHASYLRKGDVVLIPIRVGAGLRLGVNAGYMRFSEKQRWVPF
ncbi:EipA family protein [Erythrobacter sp. T5W1-R]|uniref:DUF1134 domain-containing protein n=1 Tax=Erythrobacter sp. T5W1-R TaxID=3101752 RepID=UPI002AFF8030|nr:EipA family protein [Erythrobacter sp. T5W1-R]MEA1618477.1 EipA family protein [Erythrobacter sp. T5W1-R]